MPLTRPCPHPSLRSEATAGMVLQQHLTTNFNYHADVEGLIIEIPGPCPATKVCLHRGAGLFRTGQVLEECPVPLPASSISAQPTCRTIHFIEIGRSNGIAPKVRQRMNSWISYSSFGDFLTSNFRFVSNWHFLFLGFLAFGLVIW